MALSLSNFLIPIALILWGRVSFAATTTFNWNVSWIPGIEPFHGASFERRVMGINGQWPIPPAHVNLGDNVIINLYNGLGNETTTIHVHGIFQNGTTEMDGADQVSQCGIAPGSSFVYNFTVNQIGTYWFHSHVRGQYPDGLRAPFIVHDPDPPFQFDEEVVLSFSDWYDSETVDILQSFISYKNPTGAEPIPDAALMNDTQNLQFNVQPGKTYYFRMVNLGAFVPQYIWFEGHTMRIIEVDGVYTQPAETQMIYIAPAQRYGVLITMLNSTSANFPIVGSFDTDLLDTIPDSLNTNVTGWLVYDSSNPLPAPQNITTYDPFDDYNLVPYDQEGILPDADYTANMTMQMGNLGDGANYAFINNATYVQPLVPTLYTALTTGSAANSVEIYGSNTNAFILQRDQVVDIVLNNLDTGKHPFHLHGHQFQVLSRSDAGSGDFDPTNSTMTQFPSTPMRRDTLLVRPLSNFVIRFRADNPGIWLFHCHIEWHTASGLVATIIEAPTALQGMIQVPQDQYSVCQARKIPTAGNAAGNTVDLYDLTGENKSVPPLPAGFTARGIVALVFSCISAILGMAVISWYGSMPITGQMAQVSPAKGGVRENGDVANGSANGSINGAHGVVEQVAEVPKTG